MKVYNKTYGVVLLLCLVFLFVSITESFARDEVRVVSASGLTKDEAVINCLIEAVQQVNGVNIDVTKMIKSGYSETSSSVNGSSSEALALSAEQKQQLLINAKGYLKNYEVLSIKENPSARGWIAKVRATIPVYEAPGVDTSSRYRLAIAPFRVLEKAIDRRQLAVDPSDVSRQVTQELITMFTQSRRFNVLDREFEQEFDAEKTLLLSNDAMIEDRARLGKVLGADYMVVGEVQQMARIKKQSGSRLTGEYREEPALRANVSYNIIVVATRQVKWSNSIEVDIPQQGSADSASVSAMAQAVAKVISHEALDNIYPIRIASVLGQGEFILNQGGVTLEVGDVFNVYAQGETIYDPYSKESLGRVEQQIAQIKVSRVTAKMAYASLIDGSSENIEEGSICRKHQRSSSQAHAQNATSPVPGVKLPFD